MEQFIGMYKAKRIDGNGWVEGDLITNGRGDEKFKVLFILPEDADEFDFNLSHQVLPKTVCQFTGVHDINKVKVFSGDQFDYCGETRHVEYLEDMCRFVLTTGFGYDTRNCVDLDCDVVYKREIIGNIHDI